MKYKITDKEGFCRFEEYSKEAGQIIDCACTTKIKVGNRFVCASHLAAVMLTDKSPDMEDANGKTVKFREDFLKIVNGEKVEERQQYFDF